MCSATRGVLLLVLSCVVLACTLWLQGCSVTEVPAEEGADAGVGVDVSGHDAEVCTPRTVCAQTVCGMQSDGCGGEQERQAQGASGAREGGPGGVRHRREGGVPPNDSP